jgi:trehalose 6-phosphate synthase
MADAIKTALEMEKDERIQRYRRLMEVIRGYDTATWSRSFLATLEAAAQERSRVVAPLSTTIRATLAKLARTAPPTALEPLPGGRNA